MKHKTKYGETFDILAKIYYGNEKLMHHIIQANEELRDKVFFDGEYVVYIPDMDDRIKIEEDTAPWKK